MVLFYIKIPFFANPNRLSSLFLIDLYISPNIMDPPNAAIIKKK